jgi:hypothetical protein
VYTQTKFELNCMCLYGRECVIEFTRRFSTEHAPGTRMVFLHSAEDKECFAVKNNVSNDRFGPGAIKINLVFLHFLCIHRQNLN